MSIASFFKKAQGQKLFLWTAIPVLAVSVSFGFLKQLKIAYFSWDNILEKKSDIGHEARLLLETLLKNGAPAGFGYPAIGYISDRVSHAGQRPPEEYYYNAQYAAAPVLLIKEAPATEYYLLDLSSEEAVEHYCQKNYLQILGRRSGLTLARRRLV